MTEQAAKGTQSLAVTGDATITWTNYATGNTGQCAVLRLTGTLTAAATLTFPAYQNLMTVTNAAGATVTIKCLGGTGVAIPTGTIAKVFCDGTDYYSAGETTLASYVSTLTNAGDIVVKTTLETAIAAASGLTAPFILVSAADATPGYLGTKVNVTGSGAASVAASIVNPGANEVKTFAITVGSLGLTDGGTQAVGFTAASNTRYNCVFGAAGTITLPAAPTAKDVIALSLAGNYVYTLNPNGLKINSLTSNFPVIGNQTILLEYSGATDGWV